MYLPIPESAVPNNGKVGNQVLSLPTLPMLRVSFQCYFFMYLVSSAFSLKQPTTHHLSIILINPFQPRASVQKGGHKSFNKTHHILDTEELQI